MNDLNISSAGLDQDNNVPNLTIESNSLSIPFQHQQQKLQFQNNRQRSSSSLNMPNYVQKIDDLPNEDFLSIQQQQQQPQGVNRRNSINAISPFNNSQALNSQNNLNDQSNVRKKLQERLQRNTAVSGNTIMPPQPPPHVLNSNVAVVSPVVSMHNQNSTNYPINYQQDMLNSKKSMTNDVIPVYQQNIANAQTSKMSPTQVQHHQKMIANSSNKFNTPPSTPLPPPPPQQQQHLATTTTTVTVTTQHFPLSDQTHSNPTSLSTQISMHALSPNPIVNQNVR